MPKKKHEETQAEQTARFRAEVGRMIAAGELSPTEAEETLDQLVSVGSAKSHRRTKSHK